MEDNLQEPFLNAKEDEEMGDVNEKIAQSIRNGFIVKVFGVIIYQIILTAIVIYLGFVIPAFRAYLLYSPSLYFINVIITFTCILLPLCCRNIYNKVPINYIILTIFTLSLSWVIGGEVCTYTPTSVLGVLFLTFVVVTTLIIYAWTSKKDFTMLGGILSTSLILLIFSSLFYFFFPIPLLYIVIVYGSLILFSIYLIYDIQLVVGNKSVKFSEDDYILAAMNIYLDIINLFLDLLRIFGSKN